MAKQTDLNRAVTDIHRDLVDLCKKGDRVAQYRLYKQYSQAMYNICLRMVADQDEAHDLLQKSFIKAFSKLNAFRGDCTFGVWLKRIVINQCISYLRKRRPLIVDMDENQLSDVPDEPIEESEISPDLIHDSMKYEDLILPDLNGELSLTLYESDLKAGIIGGKASISMKYSKGAIGSLQDVNLTLYEAKAEINHAGNIDNLKIQAKYCNFDLKSVKSVSFLEAYEVKFSSSFVGIFSGNSKYGEYNIYHLDRSLDLSSSYEDKIKIERIGKMFTGISVTSKYTDVDIIFETGTLYKIDATLKYTDIDFPESAFKETLYHKDGSDFHYRGVIKGADEQTCPVLQLTMYEGSLKLK